MWLMGIYTKLWRYILVIVWILCCNRFNGVNLIIYKMWFFNIYYSTYNINYHIFIINTKLIYICKSIYNSKSLNNSHFYIYHIRHYLSFFIIWLISSKNYKLQILNYLSTTIHFLSILVNYPMYILVMLFNPIKKD